MIPRLFVSYRRNCLAQVQAAVKALRAAGIDCFFDLHDIDPLDDFPERIREGIAQSHALLAWWSTDFGESDHCLAEFKLAWQHARRQSSDVGRRVWVLNPGARNDHVFAGEVSAKNFLQAPPQGEESAWARSLLARLQPLLVEGPLADEQQAAPSPLLINVPAPSNEFTGRTAEMLRIHSKLHPPQIGSARVTIGVQIHGLGGLGKTELAAKYAHEFAHAYPGGVVWLNLAGYEPGRPAKLEEAEHAWYKAVEAAFRGEFELLYDAEGKARPPLQVRRMLEQRFSGQPYLWVLDNVPVVMPENEREKILAFWRAPTVVGRTVVTTRDSRRAASFTEELLDVLGPEDGMRLLARYRRPSREEESIARKLVRTVGAHSLALTLLGEQLADATGNYARASKRLEETGLLEQIETIASDLHEELGDKARGIIATFAVSLEALDENARVVLALAAGCAPNEPIPTGLLGDAFGAVKRDAGRFIALRRWLTRFFFLRSTAQVADTFVPAVRQLRRASLLSRWRVEVGDDDSVVIHPLVSEAALRLLNVERLDVSERVAAALLARIQVAAEDIHCHPRLHADMRQARHISSALESESTVWLAIWIGVFETVRGALLPGRIAEERAVEVSRRLLGEEHPATLIGLVNLAGTLQAQGDLVTAQLLQEQALTVFRKYLDEEHELVIGALGNLGTMLHDQGKLSEARALHERTLDVRSRVLGDKHPKTLRSMSNLAMVLYAQGELAEARKMNERAVEVYRRVLGEEHPDTIRTMSNLAMVLHTQGELAEARKLNERTLEVYRRVLGEEHPDTIRTMSNLALILHTQGELAEARKLNERTLEVYRRVLGEEHPDTIRTMSNLAMVLHTQGELAEARKLNERTVEVYRRVLGEEHPHTIRTMSNLALVLHAQGELAEARKMNERAVEVYRRVLGEEHPDTIRTMSNLAMVLYAQGELAEARKLNERTVEVYRRVLGEEHPDTIRTMSNLALVLHAQGELAEARKLNERTLEVYRRVLGEEHPDTIRTMSNLAMVLQAQGELAEARALQERALQAERRVLGEEHPR